MNGFVLHYHDLAPGQPYQASKLNLPQGSAWTMETHGHDFHEFLYVANGCLIHQANGLYQRLSEGAIVLVRSRDFHNLTPEGDSAFEFYNIAVPIPIWSEFCTVTGIEDEARHWMGESLPPMVKLDEDQAAELSDAFEAVLVHYFDHPTRFAFADFWQSVISRFLQRNENSDASDAAPDWLRNACEWAGRAPNDELHLRCFSEQSSVSLAHLCRSMKKFMGVTPTEFINTLRLKRAALLLATTSDEVTQIALECGFDNISYFYRRFRTAYRKTPRDYRYTMRQSVPPG